MPLMKSGNARAKDSFTDPDYKEAENPQAHKYTHDPETKKCIHCGYGLAAHRDNGTGMVRGNKFTAYDGLKPIPVETEDQVLGHGAVGDGDIFSEAQERCNELKRWEKNGHKLTYGQRRLLNLEYEANERGKNVTEAEVKKALQGARGADFQKAVKDSSLEPIPVNDTEWNDPKPRGSYKLTTSAALKTPSEVKEAYAPRGEEGFKKTFGKDDLKPIPVGDSDESDYQEAERKLAAAKKAKASPGKLGELAAKRDDAWSKLAKEAKDSEEFRNPNSNIWSPFGDPNVPASLLNAYQKLFDEYYTINAQARQRPGELMAKTAAKMAYEKSRAAFEACRAASLKARKAKPANDCCYFVTT